MNPVHAKKKSRPVLERVFEHYFKPKPSFQPAIKPQSEQEHSTANDLLQAVERNDFFEVERLLKNGVQPHVMGRSGRLPLVEALEMGNTKIAKRLVKAGADPRASDARGKTGMGVLWMAANGGPKLDPSINRRATGEARKLYEAWKVNFPVASQDDYFSHAFRDNQLTVAQKARLDLEADWKKGALGHENPAGLVTAWKEVTNHRSLKELQQMRRAKLIPEPKQDLQVGRLPTPTSQH